MYFEERKELEGREEKKKKPIFNVFESGNGLKGVNEPNC